MIFSTAGNVASICIRNCAALWTPAGGPARFDATAYVSTAEVDGAGTSVISSRNPGAGSSQAARFPPPSHAAKQKTSASVWGVNSQGTVESTTTARKGP